MILAKALTGYTFRYISLFVAGLSAAVFLVLIFLYLIYSYNQFLEVNESITDEVDTMGLIYSGQGMHGLNQYIDDQTQRGFFNKYFYIVVDSDDQKISGNMEAWPNYREFAQDWINFEFDIQIGSHVDYIARTRSLDNGYRVMAARHIEEVYENASLVLRILFRSMVATIFFGFFGAIIASIVAERRLETVNAEIQSIVTGDLSQRMDVGDSRGDMRRLILHFNSMLDRIQSLMLGVQNVSDNIAHDLRTPLTRMRNHLTQLRDQFDGDSQDKIQELIEESDGLLATFAALLRIAQLEAGNRRSQFEKVDFTKLVDDVVELYEPLAQEKAIQVLLEVEKDLSVVGDRDLLFQMMANLFDNAVKYTDNQGLIELNLKSVTGGGIELRLADNGSGIPAADRENVFQRFFRLESSRSKYPGNGLGLSLVQALLSAHQGHIELSDNHPGLIAKVRLP